MECRVKDDIVEIAALAQRLWITGGKSDMTPPAGPVAFSTPPYPKVPLLLSSLAPFMTMPLFDKWFASKPKLNGCILRIVSSEIYTYAGKVDKALAGLLNDFFDEKRAYLKDWCELVISELPSLDGDHDVSLITAANAR